MPALQLQGHCIEAAPTLHSQSRNDGIAAAMPIPRCRGKRGLQGTAGQYGLQCGGIGGLLSLKKKVSVAGQRNARDESLCPSARPRRTPQAFEGHLHVSSKDHVASECLQCLCIAGWHPAMPSPNAVAVQDGRPAMRALQLQRGHCSCNSFLREPAPRNACNACNASLHRNGIAAAMPCNAEGRLQCRQQCLHPWTKPVREQCASSARVVRE